MPSRSVKQATRDMVLPMGRALARIGLTANGVTLVGLLFAFAVAFALERGWRPLALGCLAISAFCDLLDGAVAKARGGGSSLGAALDSSADRIGEAAIFAGLLAATVRDGAKERFVWIWSIALTSSFLTSYVRARAEGLGLRCEVGLLERPERLGLLALIVIAGTRWTEWGLGLLGVLGTITVFQRILHVRTASRSGGMGADR
jgi:CDP-diacylglycerol---glycerol-3-phosphate 3-phosphatidyltransferase